MLPKISLDKEVDGTQHLFVKKWLVICNKKRHMDNLADTLKRNNPKFTDEEIKAMVQVINANESYMPDNSLIPLPDFGNPVDNRPQTWSSWVYDRMPSYQSMARDQRRLALENARALSEWDPDFVEEQEKSFVAKEKKYQEYQVQAEKYRRERDRRRATFDPRQTTVNHARWGIRAKDWGRQSTRPKRVTVECRVTPYINGKHEPHLKGVCPVNEPQDVYLDQLLELNPNLKYDIFKEDNGKEIIDLYYELPWEQQRPIPLMEVLTDVIDTGKGWEYNRHEYYLPETKDKGMTFSENDKGQKVLLLRPNWRMDDIERKLFDGVNESRKKAGEYYVDIGTYDDSITFERKKDNTVKFQ
jgi:hypothetical protein